MKGAPLGPRVRINLLALAAVGVAALLWAAFTLVDIDRIDDPYYVTAQFEDAGLIRSQSEVALRGVRVGKVSGVSLADDLGLVDVTMRIDKGTEVPADVRVVAARKSAIGEAYLDLQSPPGGSTTDERLAGGDVIGPERTASPVSFDELLRRIDSLVAPVDPEAAGTLVHELAVGLDGRATDLRTINEGFAQLLDGMAARGAELGRLTENAATVLGTFAEHRGSLGDSIENMAAISRSLADARERLDRSLVGGARFTGMAAALVDAELAELDCLFDDLATVSTSFATDANLGELAYALDAFPTLWDVVSPANDILADGHKWARGGLVFTDAEGIELWDQPRGLPDERPVPECASPLAGREDGAGGQGVGSGQEGRAAGGDEVDTAAPGPHGSPDGAPGSPDRSPDRTPFLLAALGIALAGAGALLWRRLRS